MNTLRDFLEKVTSGRRPTAVLVGAGGVLLLVAMNAARAFLNWVLVVSAMAALALCAGGAVPEAGAVGWRFHKHG